MLHIYNLTPNTGQLVYLWGNLLDLDGTLNSGTACPSSDRGASARSNIHFQNYRVRRITSFCCALVCFSFRFFWYMKLYYHGYICIDLFSQIEKLTCSAYDASMLYIYIYMAKCFAWLRLDVCLLGFVKKWLDLRINTGMIAGFLLWRHARGGIGKVLVQRAMYKIYMYPI